MLTSIFLRFRSLLANCLSDFCSLLYRLVHFLWQKILFSNLILARNERENRRSMLETMNTRGVFVSVDRLQLTMVYFLVWNRTEALRIHTRKTHYFYFMVKSKAQFTYSGLILGDEIDKNRQTNGTMWKKKLFTSILLHEIYVKRARTQNCQSSSAAFFRSKTYRRRKNDVNWKPSSKIEWNELTEKNEYVVCMFVCRWTHIFIQLRRNWHTKKKWLQENFTVNTM